MNPAFDDLPVALPAGCVGVRIDVLSISAMAGEDAAASRRADFLAGRLAASEALRRIGLDDVGLLGRMPEGAPAWPYGITGSTTAELRALW
jgi:4'-phosphopantetheinyl transferase EntD